VLYGLRDNVIDFENLQQYWNMDSTTLKKLFASKMMMMFVVSTDGLTTLPLCYFPTSSTTPEYIAKKFQDACEILSKEGIDIIWGSSDGWDTRLIFVNNMKRYNALKGLPYHHFFDYVHLVKNLRNFIEGQKIWAKDDAAIATAMQVLWIVWEDESDKDYEQLQQLVKIDSLKPEDKMNLAHVLVVMNPTLTNILQQRSDPALRLLGQYFHHMNQLYLSIHDNKMDYSDKVQTFQSALDFFKTIGGSVTSECIGSLEETLQSLRQIHPHVVNNHTSHFGTNVNENFFSKIRQRILYPNLYDFYVAAQRAWDELTKQHNKDPLHPMPQRNYSKHFYNLLQPDAFQREDLVSLNGRQLRKELKKEGSNCEKEVNDNIIDENEPHSIVNCIESHSQQTSNTNQEYKSQRAHQNEKMCLNHILTEPQPVSLATDQNILQTIFRLSGMQEFSANLSSTIVDKEKWLNDDLVNLSVSLRKCQKMAVLSSHTVICRSFYEWTIVKETKDQFLSGQIDQIAMPMNVNGNHWVLVIARRYDATCYVIDPLGRNTEHPASFCNWLRDFVSLPEGQLWQFKHPTMTTACQTDTFSCGVWIALFTHMLSTNPNSTIEDIINKSRLVSIIEYRANLLSEISSYCINGRVKMTESGYHLETEQIVSSKNMSPTETIVKECKDPTWSKMLKLALDYKPTSRRLSIRQATCKVNPTRTRVKSGRIHCLKCMKTYTYRASYLRHMSDVHPKAKTETELNTELDENGVFVDREVIAVNNDIILENPIEFVDSATIYDEVVKRNASEDDQGVIVWIDCETTAGKNQEIVEIACLPWNSPAAPFVQLVKPTYEDITYHGTKVHGINMNDVNGNRGWKEVGQEFVDYLRAISANKPIYLVAHHVDSDRAFIINDLKRYNLELPSNVQWCCTLKMVKSLYPSLDSHSLKDLCSRFKIVIHDQHRALSDVKSMVAMVHQVIQARFGQEHSVFDEVINYCTQALLPNEGRKMDDPIIRTVWTPEETKKIVALLHENKDTPPKSIPWDTISKSVNKTVEQCKNKRRSLNTLSNKKNEAAAAKTKVQK